MKRKLGQTVVVTSRCHSNLVLRAGLPVLQLILGDGVLHGPQPFQHYAAVQLGFSLEAGRLGGDWVHGEGGQRLKNERTKKTHC